MALVTLQVQSGYTAFTPCSSPWNRGREFKKFVPRLHIVRRADNFIPLKCRSCRSVGAPHVRGLKFKSFKILSFKGIGQSEESGNRATGSTSTNNSVKLSYVPQENDETLMETPKAQNFPVSYSSEADQTTTGSLAIQRLFKSWLTVLRMPSSNQVVDETLERLPSVEASETKNGMQNKQRGEILKVVWCYFLGLDSTIKIPLLIFIPWYLVVNVIYGVEVSNELAPFWFLGPLIVALYIKMFRGLCALYVFSFKQTIKVFKSLPAYYFVASNYIARGKLKEDIRDRLLQPVVDIKNLDYKEASKRRMKALEGWLVEKYLDFVESIWPCYCRTIRFLKKANLI